MAVFAGRAADAAVTDVLKGELVGEIAAGRTLVVVGTGVSLATTENNPLASWKGLIANGVERCVGLQLADTDWRERQKAALEGDLEELLGVAEQVSRRLGWNSVGRSGGNWSEWLRLTVGTLRAQRPELIEAIRDLGAPIATLNYDNLLTEVTGRRFLTW